MHSLDCQGIKKRFDAYCKTVMRNKARDLYREEEKRNKMQVSLSALPNDAWDGLGVEDIYNLDKVTLSFAEETIEVIGSALGEALHALNEPMRSIILLYYFLGYSDSEIAEKLGIARGTVYYHKRKALDELKEELRGEYEL